MPTPVPSSGAISISALKAAFPNVNSNSLSDYEGVKWYKSDNSRGYFPSGANAYISMSIFYDTRDVSPVVPGSQNFSSSTPFNLPLFNIITFTVWGGGGGGGGGGAKNLIYNASSDGSDGNPGNTSSISYLSSQFVSAPGGGYGTKGLKTGDGTSGSPGSGADGVRGVKGTGGNGSNEGGADGAGRGGDGGNGGKSSITWNANINESLLARQLQNITISIGAGGSGGGGASITLNTIVGTTTQSAASGTSGNPGYATISWT